MSHLSFSPSHWSALASALASLAADPSVAYWTDKWRRGSCIEVKELQLSVVGPQLVVRGPSDLDYDVKAERIVSHWNVRPSQVRGGWSSQLSNYFLCYVKLHWDRPQPGSSRIIYCQLKSSYNISRSWEIIFIVTMLLGCFLQTAGNLSLSWSLHLTVPRERSEGREVMKSASCHWRYFSLVSVF